MLSPQLVVIRKLTAQVVETVAGALARDTATFAGAASARQRWKPVPDQLDIIEKTIVTLGQAIPTIAADGDLTPDARAARITAAGDKAWSQIEAASGDVLMRADEVLDIVRSAGYPARPSPQDAAQEAAIAGRKSDLSMVLDRLEGLPIAQRMSELLARALADDDALAAWVLATSRWPEDYLESRGLPEIQGVWPAYVREVLVEHSPDVGGAIAVYTKLADPQDGLPVFESLLRTAVYEVYQEIMQWRPRQGIGGDNVSPTGDVITG